MFSVTHENTRFFNKNGHFSNFFDVLQSLKRRQRLFFGLHTFKTIEERRLGHTDCKKSKQIVFAFTVAKGAAHIDA